jgi:Family of unknown function (DUF6000)
MRRHVAGATVTHESPFVILHVPVSNGDLSREMIDQWVIPLYFGLDKPQALEFVSNSLPKVTDSIVSELLANFNWRPRTAAAHIVALTGRTAFADQIGNLLLRSDVCFAGRAYCIALAELNLKSSVDFLNKYLSYYLTRQDLWFDQGDAIGAIAYLDLINGTNDLKQHLPAWDHFVREKTNWNITSAVTSFADRMTELRELKLRSGN